MCIRDRVNAGVIQTGLFAHSLTCYLSEMAIRVSKRSAFRMGLRSCLIFTAALCFVLAIWDQACEPAIRDVQLAKRAPASVVAPFILQTQFNDNIQIRCQNHVWLFGAVFDLSRQTLQNNPIPIMITVSPRIIFQSEQDLESIGKFN